ncbi:hypothetical protein FG386_000909 [Cryptosporidium ryanae]|uniref:uncharacterized protein n=1 Tax=Cryptosporidium ryanae TaxID=515981 RepID=UPI00351A3BDF|nr:hypothetical protein FG386_000909 [Cryptosporidium ryanae]
MGKRKTKKVEIRKSKIPKLDKEFNCPFCNNVKTVGVKMNHRESLGHLSCRVCGVEFTTRIGKFDEPVDIFSTWIDKCYEVNKVTTENNLNIDSGSFKDEELRSSENEKLNKVNEMLYSRKSKDRNVSFSIVDNEEELFNNINNDNESENINNYDTTNIADSGKLNGELNSENEELQGEKLLDSVRNDSEINKVIKTKEDKTSFDIGKIADSAVINKSFTMNEDDGLFSD